MLDLQEGEHRAQKDQRGWERPVLQVRAAGQGGRSENGDCGVKNERDEEGDARSISEEDQLDEKGERGERQDAPLHPVSRISTARQSSATRSNTKTRPIFSRRPAGLREDRTPRTWAGPEAPAASVAASGTNRTSVR